MIIKKLKFKKKKKKVTEEIYNTEGNNDLLDEGGDGKRRNISLNFSMQNH